MNDILPCPVCNFDDYDLTLVRDYYIITCKGCGFELKVHSDFTYPHTLVTVWNFNKRRAKIE